jgi:hypothetical protein
MIWDLKVSLILQEREGNILMFYAVCWNILGLGIVNSTTTK